LQKSFSPTLTTHLRDAAKSLRFHGAHDTEPCYNLLVGVAPGPLRIRLILCCPILAPSYRVFDFSPPLALYNSTKDLKGGYSLSFLLLLRLINAPTNVCVLTKTLVWISYRSIGLRNEQSNNGGHFDLNATKVDGIRKYGRQSRSTFKNVDEVPKRSLGGRRRRRRRVTR
jgi:hypothetical protein